MKRKHFNRLLSMLLIAATLLSLMSFPAGAASLGGSGTVTIQAEGRHEILKKSTGGTFGSDGWTFTSNDGITGTGYCINWGLKGVSPSKALTVETYNRSPKTMGAFANGFPQRTLEQFKELHKDEVRGLDSLTGGEYQYATQIAVWATCGQLSVPGTAFTAGRASVVTPTADAQQIRVFDAVKAILRQADSWSKHLYTGMYVRAEEDRDVRGVSISHELGLEGAAAEGKDGVKKETIGGKEYYTRVMYVASATSTWIDEHKTKVYSTDAPQGTIFVAENNALLETVQENGATCYKADTSTLRTTNLNANGMEFYGAFKVCIPVDNVGSSGSFTIKAIGGVAQYNLYQAKNPAHGEQSYIIADPAYTTAEGKADFKWNGTDTPDDTASLQVVKAGAGGAPLEGAEFTLTGSGGTTVTGTTDRDGRVEWTDLPADEEYTLTETAAPEGYQLMAPMSVTLTAGQTEYLTVADDTEKSFTIKKIDAQNKSALQGAVFAIEQIDGSYKTTGTTGFDGTISFEGDELPYGSYRISEQSAPEGYLKDTRVETVEWTGEEEILLTFENVREMQLVISKKDEKGVSLGGATFKIYADGKYLTSVTTNDAGEARVTGIKAEMYIEAIEEVAPKNHILDRTSHGIHIQPYDPRIEDDPVLSIVNLSKPSLRIIKYDRQSGKTLPGVTFEIYKDAELFDAKTTDDSGQIDLFDLEPGTYLIKEAASDDAHIVCTTPQQIELKAGQTATQELVFFNDLKPGMHLIKVDSADLSKPIANARFKFEAVDGSWGPEELTTLEDGAIDLSRLPTGAAVVTELDCPGYVIDDAQRIIELKPNETAQFVFTNSKKPSLKLTKTSSDGTPLGGVCFRLAKIEDGSHYLDRTTTPAGEILWEDLEPGVYSLVETATLNDHILDLREHHVELFPGKVSTITLENHKRPNLYVYKNDADTGKPVPNTVFLVRAADGHSVDEIETDAEGRAVLENLLPGVYEISEKSVPSPYLPDAPSQLVTLYPDRDHTAYFKNHKRPIIEIIKENAVTYERLVHVPFRVWYASNNTDTGEFNDLGVFYTDGEGRIELDGTRMGEMGLRDGWFRVQELEPLKGFAKADPDAQEAFIPAGQGHTFVFRNQPLSAICVWKYDSEHPNVAIEGAVFQIRYLSGNTSGTGGTVIGTYRTSANGSFTVTGLKKGTYVVEELSSDGSHVIDTPPQTVYLSGEKQEVVQVRFGNSPKGALLVKKVDARDGSPLSDVEFLVTTSDGAVVGDANGKFVTDSTGTFLVEGVEPGTSLVVKETRQKEGYVLDDVPQVAKIKAGQTVTLEFRNKKMGNLVIHKLSSADKTPLAGVQFKLTYADGKVVDAESGQLSSNGLYTTNAEGQIVLSGVTGAIIATEVAAIDGFAIDPNTRSQTIVVNPGGDTQHLYFYNTPLCSLTLKKIDSVSGKPIPNTVFSVKDGNGGLIGRYTTGKDGTVTVTGLLPGSTVVVTEDKVPDGYVLDPTPQTITLKNGTGNAVTSSGGGTGAGQGGNTGTSSGTGGNQLDFENDPIGGLELIKVDAADKSKRLPNTTFEIRKMDGGLVKTLTTGSDGRVELKLDAGNYYAVETEAAEGYKLDATPHYFTVENGKTTTLTVANAPYSGILIKKIDSATREGIYGVSFLLYDANKKPIGQYTSDDQGFVYIDDLTGAGRYYLRELENEGYLVDDQLKTVYVTAGTTAEIVWENTAITGQIQITKTSEDYNSMNGWPAGTPIPGTEFEIYHYRTGNLVDTVRTDKNGVAVSKPLPLGRYKVVESKAADFYGLDKTPIEVEIEHAGQIVKAAMTNKSLYTNVSIKKTGFVEVMPGQQIRYDFSDIANNSTAALTSFFWRDTLPTQAVRLEKLVTGTYNVRGNYKIVFKTNLNGEYRTMYDNLDTQRSYVLDASPAALGLASDEYVTEFMVAFGVVPGNFRQVEAPRVYCNVVSWLTGGTQFVNQADVGGVYNGQWIMATSRWVTRVYKPAKPLPRTGY